MSVKTGADASGLVQIVGQHFLLAVRAQSHAQTSVTPLKSLLFAIGWIDYRFIAESPRLGAGILFLRHICDDKHLERKELTLWSMRSYRGKDDKPIGDKGRTPHVLYMSYGHHSCFHMSNIPNRNRPWLEWQ